MEHRERIQLNDSFLSIASKLSEGNPGALNVIMRMVKSSEKIDPDAAMGPFAHLLNLDSFGVYGSKIWILYKDVCGEDLVNTIGVLRAVQLGMMSRGALTRAIDESISPLESVKIDIPDLLAKIREQLPNFGKVTEEEVMKG